MGPAVRSVAILGLVAGLASGCGDSELSADDLDGSTYSSTEVTGHDLVAGTTIRLDFDDGRMSATAGCNTMTGEYAVRDGTLAWSGKAASTMMACDDDLTAQDQWLTSLLTDGADADLSGDTLTLDSGDVTITLAGS